MKPFKCNYCIKRFSQKSSLTKHLRRHQLAQKGQEQLQLQANIEFFECKKGLLFIALFDDFKDNRAFKTVKGDWMVSTQRGRSRLVKAKHLGDLTAFYDLQVAVWDGTLEAGKVHLQEKLIRTEANRQKIKGTDVRSEWRTLGDTWDEIATWI